MVGKMSLLDVFLLIGLNNLLLDGYDHFAIGIDQSVRWTSGLIGLISLLDGPVD